MLVVVVVVLVVRAFSELRLTAALLSTHTQRHGARPLASPPTNLYFDERMGGLWAGAPPTGDRLSANVRGSACGKMTAVRRERGGVE